MVITRRQFIWTGISLTGGLAVGFGFKPVAQFSRQLKSATIFGKDFGWIDIAPKGSITLQSTLTEMGQGVWTCLAQIVGEELDADWSRLRVQMAPSWRTFQSPVGFYTGGSSSTQRLYAGMRNIGAAARVMLMEAAAEQWDVPLSECITKESLVLHSPSSRQISYGDLCAAASKRPPPKDLQLKPRDQWRLIGRSVPKINSPSLVQGHAVYGVDIHLPNMLMAAVTQSPLEGAKIQSMDEAKALAALGVIKIVNLGHTLAVVARTHWQAHKALQLLDVQWRTDPTVSTAGLFNQLRELLNTSAKDETEDASEAIVEAQYEAPLLMHAQLEPLNATAKVGKFNAEVWVPTQSQSAMQNDVAYALGLWTHAVTVHTATVGGGFGRRLMTDYGVAAALIAREFDVPVKCIWSREDDSLQARFRPMGVARFQARLDHHGHITQWSVQRATLGIETKNVSIQATPYDTPALTVESTGVKSPIRTGPWRSVDSSLSVFFRESFIDEIAQAAKTDPVQYRRSLLSHSPRALRVLDTVVQMAVWKEQAPNKHSEVFQGIAFNDGFDSLAAQVVEIICTPEGKIKITRIFAVVDCGTAVNPNNIQAQIEGAILFGLSAALQEEATYVDGKLQQCNFDQYQVLRIDKAPEIIVQVLETPEAKIGGIGEVGVPLIAPAVTNAIFSATGVRIRKLPLSHTHLLMIQN